MVVQEGSGVSSLPPCPPGTKATHRKYGWTGVVGLGGSDLQMPVIWSGVVSGHYAAGIYDPVEIELEPHQINLQLQ